MTGCVCPKKGHKVDASKLNLPKVLETIRTQELNFSPDEMSVHLNVSLETYQDYISGKLVICLAKAVEFSETLKRSEKMFVKFALEDLLLHLNLPYAVEIDSFRDLY